MATFTQLPSGSWRVHIRRKGFPSVARTFSSRPEAEAFALVEEGHIVRKRADVPASISAASFAVVMERYLNSTEFRNKGQGTQDREKRAAKPLVAHFGQFDLPNISAPEIQEYFDIRCQTLSKRTGEFISGDTVRIEKALLSAVFNYGILRRLCSVNPVLHARFSFTKPKHREARANFTEMRLFDALREMEKSPRLNPCFVHFVRVLFQTGMRPGELSRLRVDWVDEFNKRVVIPASFNKNRKPRVLIFPESVFQHEIMVMWETALFVGSPFLFWSDGKEGYVPFSYHKPMQRLFKHLGVPQGFVPHSFRHERISRFFESGKLTESQIALLVGDVNPMSLLRYRHLHVEKLRDAVEDHKKETFVADWSKTDPEGAKYWQMLFDATKQKPKPE